MAFSLPEFNLSCSIHTGGTAFPFGLLRLASVCNLAFGRRTSRFEVAAGDSNEESILMSLLLPAGTDIRDLKCSAVIDRVEVPSLTGRWYNVLSVDDIGKGFDNEHRCAILSPISQALIPSSPEYAGLVWPIPIP